MSPEPFELAKAAATVAAPELAIPLEVAADLVGRARGPRRVPAPPGTPVVIQPPEHTPLIRLSKDKIRVIRRRGVTIVQVERGHSLTIGETVLILGIGGLAYGTYEGYEAATAWLAKSKKSTVNPLNPTTWLSAVGL